MIARWTTPGVTFKPSAVQIADVDEIFLVIKQGDVEIVSKGIEDATVTEDGFAWRFSQEETSRLSVAMRCAIQVDYTTTGGLRYTTMPKNYDIMNSAINEVI